MDVREMAEGLTMMGLEVEDIVPVGISSAQKDQILLSKVLQVNPHPQADRLKVCKIKNKADTFTVVTNSSHITKGDFVVHAQVGTRLHNGTEITQAKLKGVDSEGMLLPKEFLGLEAKSEDIWILGHDEKIAEDLFKTWTQEDHVFNIELTANRSDCLSVIGVARELAAMTGEELIVPRVELKNDSDELPPIKIEERNLCPRYSSRILREVKVLPSPADIQRKLTLCGIRPINNIVDATNYVMLEFGHPTHAFDLKQLAGGEINVRRAKDGEKFTTLDGQEHKLKKSDLVIADAEKAVALAGIMGGLNSEIMDHTQDVLLESAYFDSITIRATSKRLGLKTESSHRFERTADWGVTPTALGRVAEIILLTAPAKVSALNDQYVNMIKDTVITLKTAFVNQKLGIQLTTKQIEDILLKIQFIITVKRDDSMEVKVPTFRADIYRPIDLVEEIARVYGYNTIPENRFMPPVDIEGLSKKPSVAERIKEVLYGMGLTDAYNYPFTHEQELKDLKINEKTVIPVANPLTRESTHLRNYLFPGLIKSVAYNYKRNPLEDIRFFELGHVFQQEAGDYFDLPKLGIVISGKKAAYSELLGIVERLVGRISLARISYAGRKKDFLHPVNSVEIILEGKIIGFAGEVHPDLVEKVESRYPLYVAELHIPPLQAQYEEPLMLRDISRFPSTSRDISIIVDNNVLARDIQNTIADFHEWVQEVRFIDLYKGAATGAGRKSLTYSLILQDREKTLTDTEVNQLMTDLVTLLSRNFKAELRS